MRVCASLASSRPSVFLCSPRRRASTPRPPHPVLRCSCDKSHFSHHTGTSSHHPHLAFVLSYCLFYVCIFERVLKHFSFFFCQGSSNLSILTDIGARQAEKCRDAITDISFDICFSSPISRAK
ncbi:hypothetical protein BHM03_00040908, partial [Ensete ventricosum]